MAPRGGGQLCVALGWGVGVGRGRSQDWAPNAEDRMVWSPGWPGSWISRDPLWRPPGWPPDFAGPSRQEEGGGDYAPEAGVLADSYSSSFNSHFWLAGQEGGRLIFFTFMGGLGQKVFGIQSQRPLSELLVNGYPIIEFPSLSSRKSQMAP